jgi:hypothetical protein
MSRMEVDRSAVDEVVVLLSYDEALVLSDLLGRCSLAGSDQPYELADRAERLLMEDLFSSFEPVIDEVFSPDYSDVVAAARRRLTAPDPELWTSG